MIGYCDYDVCGDCNTYVTVTVRLSDRWWCQIWGWLVKLFSDRWLLLLSVAIWVQHTEVPNLGVVSDAFFPIGDYCCYQLL